MIKRIFLVSTQYRNNGYSIDNGGYIEWYIEHRKQWDCKRNNDRRNSRSNIDAKNWQSSRKW